MNIFFKKLSITSSSEEFVPSGSIFLNQTMPMVPMMGSAYFQIRQPAPSCQMSQIKKIINTGK